MICPKCGATMNHHSDKVVDVKDLQHRDGRDVSFREIVEEFYSCPNCGYCASLQAAKL